MSTQTEFTKLDFVRLRERERERVFVSATWCNASSWKWIVHRWPDLFKPFSTDQHSRWEPVKRNEIQQDLRQDLDLGWGRPHSNLNDLLHGFNQLSFVTPKKKKTVLINEVTNHALFYSLNKNFSWSWDPLMHLKYETTLKWYLATCFWKEGIMPSADLFLMKGRNLHFHPFHRKLKFFLTKKLIFFFFLFKCVGRING